MSPTRSSSSKPARATAGSPATCCGPSPECARRCATCSSSAPPCCGPSNASGSRSNPPTRRSGPSPGRPRRRPGPSPARAGVRALDELPRSSSTAWCSPTSCSTTCRSASPSAPARGWAEVRVGVDDDGASPRCSSRRRRRARARRCHRGRRCRVGRGCRSARIEAWFAACGARCAAAAARHRLRRDAAGTRAAGAGGWLRTYREHRRGGSPLDGRARRTSPPTS